MLSKLSKVMLSGLEICAYVCLVALAFCMVILMITLAVVAPMEAAEKYDSDWWVYLGYIPHFLLVIYVIGTVNSKQP